MESLVLMALGFGVGLLIGWNVLPQPKWAKRLWDKVVG